MKISQNNKTKIVRIEDRGYILKVDVGYFESLHEFHKDLTFLTERMKIGKIGILVTNLHDKDKHVIHIRNLKQALNHGLVVLKKMQSLNLIKKYG